MSLKCIAKFGDDAGKTKVTQTLLAVETVNHN